MREWMDGASCVQNVRAIDRTKQRTGVKKFFHLLNRFSILVFCAWCKRWPIGLLVSFMLS